MDRCAKLMSTTALASCTLLGVPMPAAALTTQHATACVPYLIEQGSDSLSYGANGVFGSSSNPPTDELAVLCPLVRATEVAPGGLFGVWIDGTSGGITGVLCTLYSYSYTNALLGAQRSSMSSGVFDVQMTLPASQVPPYSSQYLICFLGPGAGLFDFEPVQ
ncbi:MAG: hypothetical protein JSR59_25850 [Proteobacteria bacterium]|nr:hypothetical protein [Pseudomonadota bacterium]